MQIIIPNKLLKRWERFSPSILDWKHKDTGNLLFKFCWAPESGEFLMAYPPFNHKYTILNWGSHKFHDYIRGIYFRDKKTVYLRGHEKEEWLRLTEKMLRGNGVGEEIRIIWGPEAFQEIREDLKGL